MLWRFLTSINFFCILICFVFGGPFSLSVHSFFLFAIKLIEKFSSFELYLEVCAILRICLKDSFHPLFFFHCDLSTFLSFFPDIFLMFSKAKKTLKNPIEQSCFHALTAFWLSIFWFDVFFHLKKAQFYFLSTKTKRKVKPVRVIALTSWRTFFF